MEEIKINVSIKVWIYILLAMAACWAVLMGLSRIIGGPGAIGADKYHMIAMFICMTTIILVPAYIKGKTKLIITGVQLRVNAPEPRKEDTWEGHKDNLAQDRKRRFKASLQGYPFEVYVSGLTMKPQEICDLLNERIKKLAI